MSVLPLARELANFGPVLPVRGKLPMWKEWQKRASTHVNGDPEWQDATGVGLLTGERAGYFVLDVDGEAGAATLKAWTQEHGRLPPTPTVRTGGGGFHFYFKHPGFPVRGNAGKLGSGIDVRGEGGQVVAAGSKHPSGNLYVWANGRAPHQVELADAPEWFLEKLRPKPPAAPALPMRTFDPDQAYAKQLENIVAGLKRDVTDASTPADLFGRIKTLRQQVDELIPYGKDTLGMGLSDRNAVRELKSLRASIKGTLTDEGVWGSAAVRQEAFDDAQNLYITAKREFQKRFMLKTADRSGRASYEVDPVKVNGWFNSMADPRGAIRTRALDDYMTASKNMLDEIEKSHAVAPVAEFDRQAMESVINKTGELTAEARRGQTATELFKHLQGTQILGSGPVVPGASDLAMKGLGMIAPGFVTSGVKASLNFAKSATNVPKAVATLATLERMGNSVNQKVDNLIGYLVRGSPRAESIGRSEAAAGIASAFGASREDAQATFANRTEQIRALAQDPEQLQQRLTRMTDDWHEHAPDTAQALQITTARAVAFLNSKLPQTGQAGPLAVKPPLRGRRSASSPATTRRSSGPPPFSSRPGPERSLRRPWRR